MPLVPLTVILVILGASFSFTIIESCFVSLPASFIALTVKTNVPAAAGVPEITPALEKVSPSGKVPPSRVQVIGIVPVAASVCLYSIPTSPFGRVIVIIVGDSAFSSIVAPGGSFPTRASV